MARSAPPLFERFRGRARKLVDLPDKLVGLVTQALNKASRLSHRPARLDVVVPFDGNNDAQHQDGAASCRR